MNELDYDRGSKAVWRHLLGECLLRLGLDPEATKAEWTVERIDTIACLRSLCEKHGDNDWGDDLYIADIIEKHLVLPETQVEKIDLANRLYLQAREWETQTVANLEKAIAGLRFYAERENWRHHLHENPKIEGDQGDMAREVLKEVGVVD